MIDILICQTKDEPNSTVIQLIFKCLLPKFIAASTDSRNANVSNCLCVYYIMPKELLIFDNFSFYNDFPFNFIYDFKINKKTKYFSFSIFVTKIKHPNLGKN